MHLVQHGCTVQSVHVWRKAKRMTLMCRCVPHAPHSIEWHDRNLPQQTAQLKPLRGFDRLAAAGFTEQDIANIRLQFHAHSSGDYIDQEFTSEEERLYPP